MPSADLCQTFNAQYIERRHGIFSVNILP